MSFDPVKKELKWEVSISLFTRCELLTVMSVIQHFPPTAGNMPQHFLTTKLGIMSSSTNLLFLQIL